MKKQELLRAAGIFFTGMLIFTVLSRCADSVNVIGVQTNKVQNQIITHEVSGTGKIEGTQELAVFAEEDLQIEQVCVHAGQKVAAGDAILKFTEESVQKAIKEKEDLVKTLELQLRDVNSANAAEQQKKASEQAWAGTFYDIAAQGANVSVDNARQELQAAQERLDEFYEKRREKQTRMSTEENTENVAEDTAVETEIYAESEEIRLTDEAETESADPDIIHVETETGADTSEPDTSIPETETPEFSDGSADDMQEDDRETEQALKDNLRTRQEALNEAVASADQTMASAGKAAADANLPEGSDSTAENVARQLEDAREELDRLTGLQEQKCVLASPKDGVIRSLSVESGGITSQTAAAVLHPSEGELRMTGSVSKDDLKYIETGSPVTLKDHDDREVTGAEVESIAEDEQDPEKRILTILLPEGEFSIGETADFAITRESGPYSCCVPLSAIYQENGRNYVYVTDTEKTVLGTVLTARKLEVTVRDRNQTLAALNDGSLSGDQQVVVSADRELTDGCRIREAEK